MIHYETSGRKSAFTLIELLVVVAIIAILVGLILPAVQRVREAANRISCTNNLKQIGLACHAYHNAYDMFPPGYTANAPYPATTPGWGWGAYLLPYLEQQTLFEQIRFGAPLEGQPAIIQTRLKVFLCPSDLTPDGLFPIGDAFSATLCTAAPCSYAATCGSDASEVDDVGGNGVFYRNSQTRIADIKDGTSNTTMIGDRAWADTQGAWAGFPSGAIAKPGPSNPWTTTTGPGPAIVLVHNNWINIKTDADGGLDDFSSKHLGGVNLLFADGSVRFLHSILVDGAERRAFWAMGTRAGGEVVQSIDD